MNSEHIVKMETTKDLQQKLKERNSSLSDFSKRYGYKYRTVCIVAQRWWHRKDRNPHGGITKMILNDLRKEIESEKAILARELVIKAAFMDDDNDSVA